MIFERIGEEYHRAKYTCLHNFQLYEDPDFRPNDDSLFYTVNHNTKIIWKRPSEIVEEPVMFHKKEVTCQVEYGAFSNCWIVAAMDSIAQHPALLNNTFPGDQCFSHDYVGIFRFRIWKYGTWYEVTIDDKLPYDTETDDLYCMKSKFGDFWAPLLEKALAKVLGRYEDLVYVQSNDAFVALTSGISELYSTKTPSDLLYYIMRAGIKSNSLLLAYKDDRVRYPAIRHPWMHVFVTGMQVLKKPPPRTKLNVWSLFIRIKPTITMVFGKADGLQFHNALATPGIMDEYGLLPVVGEEWIICGAFIQIFQFLAVVDLPSAKESPVSGVGGINQEMNQYHGRWELHKNAGGTITEETFTKNPKHYFTLDEPDEGFKDKQTVVIALMQKNRKAMKHTRCTKMQNIGYFIYLLPSIPLLSHRINWLKPVGASRHFAVQEVTKRFRLSLGSYVIVPCTVKPERAGTYLLRVLTVRRELNFVQRVVKRIRSVCYIIFDFLYIALYYTAILVGCMLACFWVIHKYLQIIKHYAGKRGQLGKKRS